nr:aminopeptidase N C-terminal domain-containing protein [Gemmatimonadota bacterium]
GRRSVKNVCLSYLASLADDAAVERLVAQYRGADNMTDQIVALSCLCDIPGPAREEVLGHFHRRWKDEPNVLDKWFTLQATSDLADVLERVRALTQHPDFTLANPNRARSLIGAFAAGNPNALHQPSGAGYRFLADQIQSLDALNPQVASRMVDPLLRWRRYDPARGDQMRAELARILSRDTLSRDVREKVSKALG